MCHFLKKKLLDLHFCGLAPSPSSSSLGDGMRTWALTWTRPSQVEETRDPKQQCGVESRSCSGLLPTYLWDVAWQRNKLLFRLSVKVAQLCPTLHNPWTGIFQARILKWVAVSFSDLPNPGIKLRSPSLQVDSLPAEPPGKPRNTGMGSLSLLQWIFPTHPMKPRSPALQADSLPAEINYCVFASLCSRSLSCALTNTVNRKGSEQANYECECWCDLICVPRPVTPWDIQVMWLSCMMCEVLQLEWDLPGSEVRPSLLSTCHRPQGPLPWRVSPCLEGCVLPCSFLQLLSSQAWLCIGVLLHVASKGVSSQLGELGSMISGQLACVCSLLFSRCGQQSILWSTCPYLLNRARWW